MVLNKYITPSLIKKYKNHYYRNDVKLRQLDNIDFAAFIWHLWCGRFDVIGYNTKGFLYYLMTRTESCIDIINNIVPYRKRIEKLFLN